MSSIIGRKIGMTQLYAEDGRAVPVTVLEAGPCPVVGKRTTAQHGYEAGAHANGRLQLLGEWALPHDEIRRVEDQRIDESRLLEEKGDRPQDARQSASVPPA